MRAGRMKKVCTYTPSISRGDVQTRNHRRNATKNAQKFINARNQVERLSLILAGNFDEDDTVFLTLTHEDDKLPSTKAEEKSNWEKFSRSMSAGLKRKGKEFKYIRTVEGESIETDPDAKNPCGVDYELKPWSDKQRWNEEGSIGRKQKHDNDPVRFHVHAICSLSPSDYEMARSLWPYGHVYISRVNMKDSSSFVKLASYMTKDTRKGNTRVGERCFSCSKNLSRPVITGEWVENDTEVIPEGAFVLEDSLDGTSKWSYCHRLGYIEPISSSTEPAHTTQTRAERAKGKNKKKGKPLLLP